MMTTAVVILFTFDSLIELNAVHVFLSLPSLHRGAFNILSFEYSSFFIAIQLNNTIDRPTANKLLVLHKIISY